MTVRERQVLVLLAECTDPVPVDYLAELADKRWGRHRWALGRPAAKLVAVGWAQREKVDGELRYSITDRGLLALGREPGG